MDVTYSSFLALKKKKERKNPRSVLCWPYLATHKSDAGPAGLVCRKIRNFYILLLISLRFVHSAAAAAAAAASSAAASSAAATAEAVMRVGDSGDLVKDVVIQSKRRTPSSE